MRDSTFSQQVMNYANWLNMEIEKLKHLCNLETKIAYNCLPTKLLSNYVAVYR